MTAPVLRVDGLTVSYRSRGARVPAIQSISFEVEAGTTLALVGESGSGKTTTGQAIIGLLAANASVEAGSIELDGVDITRARPRELQALRGSRIALIPQDPTVSLNPLRRVGVQIAEVFRLHGGVPKSEWRPRTVELLARVGFTDPERRLAAYPHELSGGQRQRVLIAIAIANRPSVIIADEPTSGLDVTVQRTTLDLLDDLQAELGTAIVHVTHDLAVAGDRADHVAVLHRGSIVEYGATADVIDAPTSDYARTLIASAPALTVSERAPVAGAAGLAPGIHADPVLRATGLTKVFHAHGADPFVAVDDVSFEVGPAQTLSIVGESGSGKSTTARLLTRLIEPTSGEIELLGAPYVERREREFRKRRAAIQVVYQNPYASLDPRQTVAEIVAEPLRSLTDRTPVERARAVEETLDAVALPRDFLRRRPRELSGGQRQRVAIARALAIRPAVVVLDEPVSALDASVQAQILALLDDLQREFSTSYVFISHDLSVVRSISDHVVVLERGRIVEQGATERIFAAPESEYTRALLEAIPGRGVGRRVLAAGGS